MSTQLYGVVINHEEQYYSIWPVGKPLPPGWEVLDGQKLSLKHALVTIEEVWTDMRPLSVIGHKSKQMITAIPATGKVPTDWHLLKTTDDVKDALSFFTDYDWSD